MSGPLFDHRQLDGPGIPPEDAVELYQSLVALTVGYATLSSPIAETSWAGLPDELAERLRDVRESTLRRTLRVVMDAYRARIGEATA